MQSIEDTTVEDGALSREDAHTNRRSTPMNRAIDELLESARDSAHTVGKSWCTQRFDSYQCRFCNQELGVNELDADIHIIEHFSDQAAISANPQLKEVCFPLNKFISI